jgi:hypothetical protein
MEQGAECLVALRAAARVLAGYPRARAKTDIIKIPRGVGGLGFPPLRIMENNRG